MLSRLRLLIARPHRPAVVSGSGGGSGGAGVWLTRHRHRHTVARGPAAAATPAAAASAATPVVRRAMAPKPGVAAGAAIAGRTTSAAAPAAVEYVQWTDAPTTPHAVRALVDVLTTTTPPAAAGSGAPPVRRRRRYVVLQDMTYAQARALYDAVKRHAASAGDVPQRQQVLSRLLVPLSCGSGDDDAPVQCALHGAPALDLPVPLFDALMRAVRTPPAALRAADYAVAAAAAPDAANSVLARANAVVAQLHSSGGLERRVPLSLHTLWHLLPLTAPDTPVDAARKLNAEWRTRGLVPLRALLGLNGWYEWYKRGVKYPALKYNVHPVYGVYFPPAVPSGAGAEHVALWEHWLSHSDWVTARTQDVVRERQRTKDKAVHAAAVADRDAALRVVRGVRRSTTAVSPAATSFDEQNETPEQLRRHARWKLLNQRLVSGISAVDVGVGSGVLSLCLWKRLDVLEYALATDTNELAVRGYGEELTRWATQTVRDARRQRALNRRGTANPNAVEPLTADAEHAQLMGKFHALHTKDLLVGVSKHLVQLRAAARAAAAAADGEIDDTADDDDATVSGSNGNGNAHGTVDLIVFNPPWIPATAGTKADNTMSQRSGSLRLHDAMFRPADRPSGGGKHGSSSGSSGSGLFDRFFEQSYRLLHGDGRVCVVYSNLAQLLGREKLNTTHPIERELREQRRFALVKRWDLPLHGQSAAAAVGASAASASADEQQPVVQLYELRKLPVRDQVAWTRQQKQRRTQRTERRRVLHDRTAALLERGD